MEVTEQFGWMKRQRQWCRTGVAALCLGFASIGVYAQGTAVQALLDKAHAQEIRGRLDMAAQTWQQVLLSDPNNTEALGGLARASKVAGNDAAAAQYLQKLKAINPNDPGIARAETVHAAPVQQAKLDQASKLAQAGQYSEAMDIYKQVFGNSPPPGDWALAYYETEAATTDGKASAIAGLRTMVSKYPQDSRYQIALGRILTYTLERVKKAVICLHRTLKTRVRWKPTISPWSGINRVRMQFRICVVI